jgi:hypothetical protein
VDEHLALDEDGIRRGFITFCLHWKHTKDFGGLAPTGREGTSVETALLTIVANQITRIDVADNTLEIGTDAWHRRLSNPAQHSARSDRHGHRPQGQRRSAHRLTPRGRPKPNI